MITVCFCFYDFVILVFLWYIHIYVYILWSADWLALMAGNTFLQISSPAPHSLELPPSLSQTPYLSLKLPLSLSCLGWDVWGLPNSSLLVPAQCGLLTADHKPWLFHNNKIIKFLLKYLTKAYTKSPKLGLNNK